MKDSRLVEEETREYHRIIGILSNEAIWNTIDEVGGIK
jgi:hypothetical protein